MSVIIVGKNGKPPQDLHSIQAMVKAILASNDTLAKDTLTTEVNGLYDRLVAGDPEKNRYFW